MPIAQKAKPQTATGPPQGVSSGNANVDNFGLRASFEAYFDFVDEHAEGFRMMMQETVGTDDVFRSNVGRVRDHIMREVSDLIVRESQGRLDRDEADDVALALVGMVETAARHDPGGPRERRRRTVDTLVRLAWRGITALTL